VGVLDDPAGYYGPPQADWALGDLVLVPVAALWDTAERSLQPYPQPMPAPDGSASVLYPLWLPSPPFVQPAVEAWLTPAMLVVDDCVLDKEFNAFVERRMREGVLERAAEEEARARPDLDPLVPVAPMLPYTQLSFTHPEAVRQGQAIGYFPVVAAPGQMDEGYVDFTRAVPVSRQLLRGPLAALTEPARRILRWKLAQFYAVRSLSIDAEITAALGKTVTGVRVVSDHKDRLIVDLELDHGQAELRLRQEPRRPDAAPGHQRGRSR
jgi:hypothetical protein